MGNTRGRRALAEEYWGGSSFRWNDKHCLGRGDSSLRWNRNAEPHDR